MHLQYMRLSKESRQKGGGANPRGRKKLKTAWANKKGKGAMPKKRHCSSLRIEASFPIMKQKLKNASLLRKEQIWTRLRPNMSEGGLSFRVGLICRRIKLHPNELIPAFECTITTAEIIEDSCIFTDIPSPRKL